MINVVKHVYRNYATFGGRASRSEFWIFQLFHLLVALIFFLITLVAVIAGTAGTVGLSNSDANAASSAGVLTGLIFIVLIFLYFFFVIASIVPSLAVTARRLHDANISAWWLLILIVPFGSLVVFVMTLLPSFPGVSRFEYEGSGRNLNSNNFNSQPAPTSSHENSW
jgi:uncharacterized membrane protein YhaH (DUF805 family)